MKLKSVEVFGLALALLSSSSGLAYIPPTHFIIKTLAAKHTGFKGVRVKSTVTAYEGEKAVSTRFQETTFFDPSSGSLRSVAIDDAGKELYIAERKGSELLTGDALLFEPNGETLGKILRAHGVPVQVGSLSTGEEQSNEWLTRWNAAIAWVIGFEKPNQKWKAQLWIEKDTFLPLRILLDQRENPTELRFDNYRFYREFPFPRAVMLVNKAGTALRAETSEVTLINEAKESKSTGRAGFTDAGNSAPSSLRDLVRQYYEAVR